jgi:hypothetical protein
MLPKSCKCCDDCPYLKTALTIAGAILSLAGLVPSCERALLPVSRAINPTQKSHSDDEAPAGYPKT